MPQNLNYGFNYFMDVLFVEAEILTVAHVKNMSIPDVDRLLYPTKKYILNLQITNVHAYEKYISDTTMYWYLIWSVKRMYLTFTQ